MYVTIFASGSTGNCALISQGSTNILVDAGLSARRIGACLAHWNLSPQAITAGVITHSHSDHIAGLPVLTRRVDFPLYATAPTCLQLCYRMAIDDRVHPFAPGEGFSIGDVAVQSIPTSHDAPGSVGYRFTGPDGKSACIVTDLGVVTPEVTDGVRGCGVAVVELNHDPTSLQNGPYPYPLKVRIAGEQGHLANAEGAGLCALAAASGAHTVVLAHLSQHNNSPALARAAAQAALADHPEVRIEVAPVFCDGLRLEV